MTASMPGSGELQRRILIRNISQQPDGNVGFDLVYDAGIPRWAKVEPVHGIALRLGVNEDEVPTHLFWVRYGTGTKPEEINRQMVIDWNGQRYRILDAINVEDAQKFTRITAKHLGVAS
jgi:hypothetical protein